MLASCTAIASTSLDSTATSAPLASPDSSTQKVSSAIRAGKIRVAYRAEEHLGGLEGHLIRGARLPRGRGSVVVEADEEQHDRRSRAIGHPQLVLGDREEASDVRQARQLVNRREIPSQLPSFDGVADGSGEKAACDRAVDEVILRAGVKGHGAVGLSVRAGEDQDGGGGDLEPERLERLERSRVVERHDHRVLVGSRAERREVGDPGDLETLAFELGSELVAGAYQQHADVLASHVLSSRAGSSYPAAPRRPMPATAHGPLP